MSAEGTRARHAPKGSKEARRAATVVLEALGGLRSAASAADALDIAVARYYVLERRAIQGMVEALERRPRGRQRTLESELNLRDRRIGEIEQELLRYQSLYRASQRAMGVAADSPATTRKKKRVAKTTRVRRKSRAEKVLSRLGSKNSEEAAPPADATSDGSVAEEV